MGWQTDWLYDLIFDNVREVWREAERFAGHAPPKDPQPPPDRIVVFETLAADFDRSECRLPIRRKWSFDGIEFRGISLSEESSRPLVRRHLFAEASFRFCISPDRKRVVIEYVLGPLYGRGNCYRVRGQARTGSLASDTDAYWWIS